MGQSLIEKITSKAYITSPEYPREFRFKTPKKKMILDLFNKELCHDWSSVLTKAETKEDLRQLCCLDEVYFYLNAARRERLNHFENIAEMLNESVKLYRGQKIASELRNQIDSFLEYEKRFDYEDLSPEKVKGIRSKSKSIEDLSKDQSQDFEVQHLSARLENLVSRVKNKLSDRESEMFRDAKEYDKKINALYENKSLTEEDLGTLAGARLELDRLIQISKELGNIKEADQAYLKEMEEKSLLLIKSYEDYKQNKGEFDKVIKRQKRAESMIPEILHYKPHILPPIERISSRAKIKRYMSETREYLQKIYSLYFYNNRYFKQEIMEINKDLKERFESLQDYNGWDKELVKEYVEILNRF